MVRNLVPLKLCKKTILPKGAQLVGMFVTLVYFQTRQNLNRINHIQVKFQGLLYRKIEIGNQSNGMFKENNRKSWTIDLLVILNKESESNDMFMHYEELSNAPIGDRSFNVT